MFVLMPGSRVPSRPGTLPNPRPERCPSLRAAPKRTPIDPQETHRGADPLEARASSIPSAPISGSASDFIAQLDRDSDPAPLTCLSHARLVLLTCRSCAFARRSRDAHVPLTSRPCAAHAAPVCCSHPARSCAAHTHNFTISPLAAKPPPRASRTPPEFNARSTAVPRGAARYRAAAPPSCTTARLRCAAPMRGQRRHGRGGRCTANASANGVAAG